MNECSGTHKIRWLGEEALRRYLKLRPPSFVPNREERVHDIRDQLYKIGLPGKLIL